MDATQATPRPAPLDDVMLAMDVVDTLRHRQQLVEQELARPETDEQLIARLRKIYADQGIEVPDRILREGVEALREDRFTYSPPRDVPLWVRIYVRRGVWARRILSVALVVLVAVAAYQAFVVAPRTALAADIERSRAVVTQVAVDPEVRARAETLADRASAALAGGNASLARAEYGQLEELERLVEMSYSLVITSGPEVGVWRTPELNQTARNYYLIVDAVDEQDRPVSLPVRNEETGETERVSTFGLGVTEAAWDRVAADLEDDGIIQVELVGSKARGVLEPKYVVETRGGAITRW